MREGGAREERFSERTRHTRDEDWSTSTFNTVSLSLSGHEDTFSACPAFCAGLPIRPQYGLLCRPRYHVRQTPETHSLLAAGDSRLRLRFFAEGDGNGQLLLRCCSAPPSLYDTQAAVMGV